MQKTLIVQCYCSQNTNEVFNDVFLQARDEVDRRKPRRGEKSWWVTQIQTCISGNYAIMELSEMAMCGNIKARTSKLMVYTHYFEGEKIIFLV
jgi:hypothetical protein